MADSSVAVAGAAKRLSFSNTLRRAALAASSKALESEKGDSESADGANATGQINSSSSDHLKYMPYYNYWIKELNFLRIYH